MFSIIKYKVAIIYLLIFALNKDINYLWREIFTNHLKVFNWKNSSCREIGFSISRHRGNSKIVFSRHSRQDFLIIFFVFF